MEAMEIRKLIEQLQIEIQQAKTINEKDQKMLIELDAEIHKLLEQTEANGVQIHPSTIKSLEDSLNHFEETHPTLTMLISQVLDALSSIGI